MEKHNKIYEELLIELLLETRHGRIKRNDWTTTQQSGDGFDTIKAGLTRLMVENKAYIYTHICIVVDSNNYPFPKPGLRSLPVKKYLKSLETNFYFLQTIHMKWRTLGKYTSQTTQQEDWFKTQN